LDFNQINNYDGFQALAPYNDTFFDKPNPLENEEFMLLHKYIKQLTVPGNKFLDAGCGTGDLCFYMANNGYNVTGVDFSDNMLLVARNKLALFKQAIEARQAKGNISSYSKLIEPGILTSIKPALKFIAGDITNANGFDDKFNLISMLNTLSFLKPEKLSDSIKYLYNSLHAGGFVIMNIITKVEFEHAKTINSKNDNFDYSISYNYEKDKKIQTTRYQFNQSAIVKELFNIDFIEYEHRLIDVIKLLSSNNFVITKIIPNTPVFSINDSDISYICDAIESSFSMPNGVRNVIIAAYKQ